MGQRHQAFLIARIVPHGAEKARYRCIAAIHHQWCYGSLPLRAAHRLMTLVKQPENAEIVREELRALDGLYGQSSEKPVIPNQPCPFTQFLFESAWSTDLSSSDDVYSSSSSASLSASMGSTEGDNNDGITVIDITTPEIPSYCFIIFGSRHNKILSALQYIRIYYPAKGKGSYAGSEEDSAATEEMVKSVVLPFDSIRIISRGSLAEAWPKEYKPDTGGSVEVHKDSADPKQAEKHAAPSLVELTIKPAVEQAIAHDNVEALNALILEPNNANIVKGVVFSMNPIPDAGISLLGNIMDVQKSRTLDLSGVRLHGEQIIRLLDRLAKGSNVIDVLKLSHNNQVNVDVLQQILVAYPTVRHLALYKTAVTDADIIKLLGSQLPLFYHMESIVHPALFKPTFQPSPAFTLVIDKGRGRVSLPFFTPNQIAQALIDYFGVHDMPQFRFEYGSVLTALKAAQVALATESRLLGRSWAERPVPFVPCELAWNETIKPHWWFIVNLAQPKNLKTDPLPEDFGFNIIQYIFMRPRKDSSQTPVKHNDTEDGCSQFDLFDVRAFFKELEAEGRPAADLERLDRLYKIFVEMGGENSQYLELLDRKSITGILKTMPPPKWSTLVR